MKNLIVIFFTFLIGLSQARGQSDTSIKSQIDTAIVLVKSGKHLSAAQKLLFLARTTNVAVAKPRIKYMLGLSLMELNLNQIAAFQFVDVVRSGDVNWTKLALEKLLIVTDKLGDETLLNFAIQRVEISQIPAKNREMLYYRLADIKHKAGQQEEAIPFYQRVTSQSRYYYNALYNLGLAQAELGQVDQALLSFRKLLAARSSAKVTDTNKVAAQMAIARTYYQKEDWTRAIEAYAKIPRDHALWHAALFEKTWAMLRNARFRSTLSNFQSLHSAYYDDAYLPETLLLRAIVYLYICQYDEMEKVLSLYESQYGPSFNKVTNFLKTSSLEEYFQEIHNTMLIKAGEADGKVVSLPYNILKHISAEGDVRRSYSYLKRIVDEKKLVEENDQIKSTLLGQYAGKLLTNRINSTKAAIGSQVKRHLGNIKTELNDLSEQSGFIRYEMINGRKELLKRKIEGKAVKAKLAQNEKQDREFYIQNGYEYYPFQGEYWLDEIGNYHYLGKQSCE